MAGYLVISVLTGIFCATVSYFGFGTGLLSVIFWYIAGCWAGFAASVVFFLLTGTKQQPTLAQWHQGSAIR